MSEFSMYKTLAFELLEENASEEAIRSIAQGVLDKHIQMDENEFNSDLMPDASDIPFKSDYYHMIKKLVVKALKEGSRGVNDINITYDEE